MRIDVSSGAGSVPAAADAVAAPEGAADGVAVPPPHATTSIPTPTTAEKKARVNLMDDISITPPPSGCSSDREKCNRMSSHRLQFDPNQMRSTEPSSASSATQSGRIDVAGQPIAYALRGTGVPLLLVAGTGYPGATWPAAVLEPLARRHTVLTFDQRGTGATPPSATKYSTRVFAADALGLLDALELDAAHVAGHSMGGRVAQWMALERPDRVRTLVLAATGPGQFRDDRPVARGVPVHTAVELIEKG